MFQTKSFAAITQSMIAHMRASQDKITDFTVGSVARTLVEAPAVELDEFYQRILYGLLEAIPTAVYHAFNFTALPGASAGGVVRFKMREGALAFAEITIPAGTAVMRSQTQQKYLTRADGYIRIRENFVDIMVSAEYTGGDGDAPAGALSQILTGIDGISAVENPLPIVGGRYDETPSEQKLRFISYIGSLSRGTVWSLDYAVRSAVIRNGAGSITQYVERVGIKETPGRIEIYLLGATGGTSAELVAAAEKIIEGEAPTAYPGDWIPGYRAAGVECRIRAMEPLVVNVAMSVTFFDQGKTVDEPFVAAARTALSKKIHSVLPGQVITVDELLNAVLGLRDVKKVVSSVDENILCLPNQYLALGSSAFTLVT